MAQGTPVWFLHNEKEYIDLASWVNKNTKEDEVFLINPIISNWYTTAQRAVYIGFKHIPQSEIYLEEWYNRIKKFMNNKKLSELGYSKNKPIIDENYKNLDNETVIAICTDNNIRYFVDSSNLERPFEVIFRNTKYILYEVLP